jgi:universal stress protein A
MNLIRRILCPVDFSDASRQPFDYAVNLAHEIHAELIVAHAFDVPAELSLAGQSHPADAAEKEKLHEYKPAAPLTKIDYVLHAGSPGPVICWLAQERQCDLIVMGSHGKGGLTHLLFGSVTEAVLRHSQCPVLVIRHRQANEAKLEEPLVLPVPAPRFM